MEAEDSFPLPQEPSTSPCPELEQSSPYSSSYFLKVYFSVILPSTPMFPE